MNATRIHYSTKLFITILVGTFNKQKRGKFAFLYRRLISSSTLCLSGHSCKTDIFCGDGIN